MNSLKPNEVSEPIKSQFGYHLIQVIERRMEKNGNPQRMRIAARQQLREKKLGEAVYNCSASSATAPTLKSVTATTEANHD